jgi:hypothetical protein
MRFWRYGVLILSMLPWSATALRGAAIVTSVSGLTAPSIQAGVDAFRASLGVLNPNVTGSFNSGRREINWDGVPDALSAPNNLPANFFNSNSPRGVVFSTPGSGFQVSANAVIAPIEFDNINPTYSAAFQTFSPQRLFTTLGSNVLDINFFVPGTSLATSTTAFGAVFTDADLTNTTSIQYFDLSNTSLGTFFVPAANTGLSFLGVQFNAGERIGRVRITSGNAALGPNETLPSIDVVAMDDFIYAEPSSMPEPGSVMLLVGGIAILASFRRRRRMQLG